MLDFDDGSAEPAVGVLAAAATAREGRPRSACNEALAAGADEVSAGVGSATVAATGVDASTAGAAAGAAATGAVVFAATALADFVDAADELPVLGTMMPHNGLASWALKPAISAAATSLTSCAFSAGVSGCTELNGVGVEALMTLPGAA